MTIDTVVFSVAVLTVVFIDGLPVKRSQIALIQAELSVEFVTGLDETVRKISVYGLCRHGNGIGTICFPAVGIMRIDRNGNTVAFAMIQQIAPFGTVEKNFAIAAGSCQQLMGTVFHLNDKFIAAIAHHEVQGSNVGRYDHIGIIGIYP